MLQSLVGPVVGLLDKFIEDKDAKNALAHEINTMATRHAQELAKGQLEVNKVEAASSSVRTGHGIKLYCNTDGKLWPCIS
jgi:hypothetical protein